MDFRPRRLGGGGRRGRLQARGRWSGRRPRPSSRRPRVRLSSAWSISSCEQIGLSRVLAGPFVEACDFPRGLPRGLELLNPLPGHHGVDEGDAVSDAPWRDGEAVGLQGVMGFAGERASGRDCGEGGDVARGGDGAQVEDRGSAGDQDQIGREGGGFGVWGGVDMRVSAAPCSRAVARTSSRRAVWADTTTGVSAWRWSDQAALAWGMLQHQAHRPFPDFRGVSCR